MSVSRPLNKDVLKKLFLKLLHEHTRTGGKYTDYTHGYDAILGTTLAPHFALGRLTTEEYNEGRRAVYELERDGFIAQDTTQDSDVFKVLTKRGLAVVERDLAEMELPSINIDELLSREDLRDKVRDDYIVGDYEWAVFKAFKLVEETVRRKAGQPASLVGVNLMSTAFKTGGVLTHP